jgi:hypothetical protein
VVVQSRDQIRVVETFDEVPRLGIVLCSVHVLQHVHVLGDSLEPGVLVEVTVQEVDVAGNVRRPLAQSVVEGGDQLHPGIFSGNYDLVGVEQHDVLELLEVLVETVVVRDDFLEAPLEDFLVQETVLEVGVVGVVPHESQRSHFDLSFRFVILQQLLGVRVDLKLVEVDLFGT